DGVPLPGVYVSGWIKRGPRGVIGSNRIDSEETVEHLLADLHTLPRARHREPGAIIAELTHRGLKVITWAGWKAIDAAEQALGVAAGRTRIKIADREALLVAAAQARTR
ncbi:MAG TPA: pyridine nucleotide-disulfide oxidoreductase, partial [Pseudonocardiaceae bacterium]|nr:pyridine nucleotide-disulfide oxidoreductase [Pseudonocardiaceae bacterium]